MTPRRALPLLRCLLLFWFACPAFGQEWTRFRGPNGSGESDATTLPDAWTISDCNWRVKLPGIGYSSPVIWGGRVFVTCSPEENATRMIRCLDTSDGGLVWERQFDSSTHPKNDLNCYAAATPVVDGDRVYMTWTTPKEYIVLALDQDKGDEVWRRDLGPFAAQHGYGASPILFDGRLIVTNDQDNESFTIALDCVTGETRWKAARRTEKAAYSTPCIYRPESGLPELILTSWAHGVNSLDPTTGKVNWEVPVLRYRVVCSPVVAGGLIFTSCGSGSSGKQMVAVRPGNAAQGIAGEVAYEIKGSLPYVPTSVGYGRLLFLWGDTGVVTCLDAPTGNIHWRERIGGRFFGSPVRVADRLYCMSRDGEMVVLAAADQYQLLARIDLEEPSNSSPAVADGVMYLRTASHLMAIGEK
ncbi:MAG: PQQ-binding-like beta-propeller repeat protein [Pirellulales bacterium]|nr:PQQ-binding-like beta-propeller repeat protein [Pirellulales bacterium]